MHLLQIRAAEMAVAGWGWYRYLFQAGGNATVYRTGVRLMGQSAVASNTSFLSGPLRAVAEMIDSCTGSREFHDRVEALRRLSDPQLAQIGLRRSEIARHVLKEMSSV